MENGVARAVRLAANLSNQLFVDLPPEATTNNSTTSNSPSRGLIGLEAAKHPKEVSNTTTSTSQGSSSATSPSSANAVLGLNEQPAGGQNSAGSRKTGRGAKQKKQHRERKHKSLSPEKRLASTLAQSMSSISKSFEKLDLVGRAHLSSRHSKSGAQIGHHPKRQRRRSRPPEQPPKQKEVTIAKLGRFKFSVEVAKHFDEELKKIGGNGRKKSAPPAMASAASKETAHNSKKASRKESNVAKLPSIHVTNFNSVTSKSDQPQPPRPANDQAQQPFINPQTASNGVIVSKKRKERPRREISSPEKEHGRTKRPSLQKQPQISKAGLDYRKSFGGSSSVEKFTRSISHPGPGPNLQDLLRSPTIDEPSSNSSSGLPSASSSRRPSKATAASRIQNQRRPRLRRSETERLVQKPSSDHLWVAEFDNQGFSKSPEPVSLVNPAFAKANAVSLNSLHKANEKKLFESSSCSTDSDLELVSKSPPIPESGGPSSNPISRAKILETVGVIVKPETTSPGNNLLLPPSSSSPSSSSSVSLTGATSLEAASSTSEAADLDEEPRLAFIGCETTSTLSSPLSLGGATSSKRPSLSERYPTSTSTSSSSEAKSEADEEDNTEDNLDIISIITDGMN